MISCILTIIKNEQPYLDEWISYHLGMGISYILILEDIGSDSHKDIVDKYQECVKLASGLSLLTEPEKDLVLKNRAKNIPGGQKTYAKAGLRHIKEHYDYDWCFIIDNDEFLTLEEGKTLDDVLDLYKDYDAFIMSWQCYGANGLVNKPDYSVKGVIDTYTKPVKGFVPATSKEHNKKICYNLAKYKSNFWSTIHVPADICNFCNTDYKKDKYEICHKNIYIRHYITKSWEEYVWKKMQRGYFYGKSRTFNAFFDMNPDMKPLERELLSEIYSEKLVILPYSQRGSQGNELRLALTGWRKFCLSRYKFVIIGDFDETLRKEFPWVQFIYESPVDRLQDQYYPHLDIQHKMEVAYNLFKDKYLGFIWMTDDNYAIRNFYINEMEIVHYHQPTFTGKKDAPISWWKHDKWKTRQLLDRENLPHVNYTTHFPCYFEFERLKELWDKFNMCSESYVIEDIYFNYYEHDTPILDDCVRIGIWDKNNAIQKLKDNLPNSSIKFVCNSEEGWSKELEDSLTKIIQNNLNS